MCFGQDLDSYQRILIASSILMLYKKFICSIDYDFPKYSSSLLFFYKLKFFSKFSKFSKLESKNLIILAFVIRANYRLI